MPTPLKRSTREVSRTRARVNLMDAIDSAVDNFQMLRELGVLTSEDARQFSQLLSDSAAIFPEYYNDGKVNGN